MLVFGLKLCRMSKISFLLAFKNLKKNREKKINILRNYNNTYLIRLLYVYLSKYFSNTMQRNCLYLVFVTMGPGLLQPLFTGFSSYNSELRTAYTPWFPEIPHKKSRGVQMYVNNFCLFLKHYW